MLAALALPLGCGEGVDTGSGPTIAIRSPAEGSTACGAPLRVELSNADHTPVDPYVGDMVTLASTASACR